MHTFYLNVLINCRVELYMQFMVFLSYILLVLITYVYHDGRFRKRKGLLVGFILGMDRYYGPYDLTVCVGFLLV